MRAWLSQLCDESNGYIQTLFCPDIRIQTVLAVEKAAKIPLPKGDPGYPALNEALQAAWGARITSSFLEDHPVPTISESTKRRSHSGRIGASSRLAGTSGNSESVPSLPLASAGLARSGDIGMASAKRAQSPGTAQRQMLLRKTHAIVCSPAACLTLMLISSRTYSGHCACRALKTTAVGHKQYAKP
jgi:hypothetical protein